MSNIWNYGILLLIMKINFNMMFWKKREKKPIRFKKKVFVITLEAWANMKQKLVLEMVGEMDAKLMI